MSDFPIEKDIPLPTTGRRVKYPFKDMEVGDSFFVPPEGHFGGEPLRKRINQNAYQNGRKIGMKFITRVEKRGVRVWRTE